MLNSAERFSTRVAHYIKYRPGYPAEIIDELSKECDLRPDSVVADIGSGTGKSSELFVRNANLVFGVEPNAIMRTAAEEIFQGSTNFKNVEGSAENTTLPEESVDFVVAGQAFHWFDRAAFRVEANRILKPGGWVVLFWNGRKLESTQFLEEYEKLLMDYGTDYQEVRHENVEIEVPEFFSPGIHKSNTFHNQQVFDLDGLEGRLRSSSYTPEADHPNFQPMMAQLHKLFDKHQRNGTVVFEYDTRVFYGHLS